jgi:DNA-binding phage protein
LKDSWMKTEIKPFDAAPYLDTPEAQAEVLNDALETGVTREALYKSLSLDGDPKLTTLLGVLKSLGFTLSAHTTAH